MRSLSALGVIFAVLFASASALHVQHEQTTPTYSLFDYINGRVQTVSHCFHVIPEDDSDTFTWQPNNLHIEGGQCGTLDCSFTMQDHAFTMGTCNPPETGPCVDYMKRMRESSYIALESNLIKLKNKEGENEPPNIVFMDKK